MKNKLNQPMRWWIILLIAIACYVIEYLLGDTVVSHFVGLLGLILLVVAVITGIVEAVKRSKTKN